MAIEFSSGVDLEAFRTMNNRTVLLVPLLGLLWGSGFVWIRLAANDLDLSVLVFGRLLVGLSIMTGGLLLCRVRLPAFGMIWFHVFVFAIFADLLPMLLLVWGQRYVASSTAAVIGATIPIFTLLYTVFIFRMQRLSFPSVIGVIAGMAGISLISVSSGDTSGSLIHPAILAILVSSALYGFGFVYSRRYIRGHPIAISTSQFLVSFMLIAPLALIALPANIGNLWPVPLLAVIGLGTFASGLGYIAFYASVIHNGPTLTSFGVYLSTIFAVFLGWLVFRERIGLEILAGAALVIFGIIIASGGLDMVRRTVRVRRLQGAKRPVT